MTPSLPARRRAEEFDAALRGGTATDQRYADLLEVVATLRSVPEPQPRPEFVADLRERLMAEAEQVLVTLDRETELRLALPVRRTRRDRRIATVVGGVIALGATASVGAAAQDALPGEALYPIKRALESAGSGFGADDATRGAELLEHATARLDELDALARRGTRSDIAAVPGTLETFVDQAESGGELLLDDYAAGGDAEGVEGLRTFAAEAMDRLEALEARLPDADHEAVVEAARSVAALDQRAEDLCPECGGGLTEVPRILLTSDLAAGQLAPPTPPAVFVPSRPATLQDEVEAALDATGQTLPPGSVNSPDDGSGTTSRTQDPVTELTDQVTGGLLGGTDTPTSGPSAPSTGGAVGEVTEGVGEVTDPVTGAVTDEVDTVLDGLTDPLLP